jgi:methionine biosynthesis protein MetW
MKQFEWTRKPNFKDIKYFDYDEYWKQFGVNIRSKLRQREDIFIDWIKPESMVLDLACGNSPLLLELKKRKHCKVEGVEVSKLIAAEQEKAGVAVAISDVSSVDFSLSKKYDYIVLSEILEHLQNPELLLKKIRSNSKYLIISIPNSAFYRFRFSLLFRGRFFTQWAWHPSEHIRFWSHIDFMDWLSGLGFKVIEAKASNGLTFAGLELFKKNINLFGFQICYLVKKKDS